LHDLQLQVNSITVELCLYVFYLPYAYVRPEPKSHGTGQQIEGRAEAGQKVVLVEDLVSTGGSSISAVQALAAEGGTVAGLACVFTYGFAKATQAFAEANIPFVALSDYDALLTVARAQGRFSEADLASLAAWRQAPELWGR
jgi:orotate phosphoribosyltransferase